VLNHPEQYLATLRGADLFQSLSDDELTAIGRLMAKCELPAGQVLFNEGDACEGLYVVERGAVKIFKTSATGREQVLTIEHPGGVVAELPVFDDGPYPASCQAVESSLLLFLSKSDFRAICRESPELALKVLEAVGRRLRRLVGLIEELSFTTVRQRLAASLLRRADAEGARSDRGTCLTLPANHEIGAEIGTVRELVSRNLSRFQSEGLIRMDGKEICILDLEGLRAEIDTC
jgi:CRP/FNR family transcriptional regulator